MELLKNFDSQKYGSQGIEHYQAPGHHDGRGALFEAFHHLKTENDFSGSAVYPGYPYEHQVYGPYSVNGDQFLYVIKGKLFCAFFETENKKLSATFTASKDSIVKIPTGCIFAYVAAEEKTLFDIIRINGNGAKVVYKLEDFDCASVNWPEAFENLKQATLDGQNKDDFVSQSPDFAIMGANGLIGSSFARAIEIEGKTWLPIHARLNENETIKSQIAMMKPKVSVIIAAGVGTRPNTKWCDTHQQETIDCNVTAQIAIIKICKELGVHCTIIGTTGFYSYDAEHPIGGKGFVEDDPPNHNSNFYFECRIRLENMLKESGDDKHCLNLRAVFPVAHQITTASIIGKLLRFNTVFSIPSSITVLPALCPLALKMMEDKEVGSVNFVCDGVISNGDILRLYQKIVDPSITIREKVVTAEENWAMGASAQYAVPQRLINKFGKVISPQDAISDVLKNLEK